LKEKFRNCPINQLDMRKYVQSSRVAYGCTDRQTNRQTDRNVQIIKGAVKPVRGYEGPNSEQRYSSTP
jgi:hypothetical protein